MTGTTQARAQITNQANIWHNTTTPNCSLLQKMKKIKRKFLSKKALCVGANCFLNERHLATSIVDS
jgi:hypothetical protein